MKREYLKNSIFFLIAAVFFYLFYQIIIPFFVPMAWAAVFAILFFPINKWMREKTKSPAWTAILLCVLIVVVIIAPSGYLFMALVSEAGTAASRVNDMYHNGELDNLLSLGLPWLNSILEKTSDYYDLSKIDLDAIVRDAMAKIGGVLVGQTSWLVANGTKAVFYFILMIFTLFYFFKDGERVVHKVQLLMPFTDVEVSKTTRKLYDVIQATMLGGVVVALMQGVLGGILFAVMGIPSPIFWGAVMAFLAIIPFVGAFLVYIPAGIILIVGGSYVQGLLIIAIGIGISQTDNIVRPKLISGRTKMHPLMLFFAIMGGISLFGMLGLVLGPFIAAVFLILIKVIEGRLQKESDSGPSPA